MEAQNPNLEAFQSQLKENLLARIQREEEKLARAKREREEKK